MSKPLEHDMDDGNCNTLNFKETELRLGLPGTQSPERKSGSGSVTVSLFGKDLKNKHNDININPCSVATTTTPLKNFLAGAKRGFSDAIDGSDVAKSLIGLEGSSSNTPTTPSTFTNAATQTIKEVGNGVAPQSAKIVHEKNNQVAGTNENAATAPAAKAQVVGWPPIRSFRKNTMASNLTKNNEEAEGKPGFGCLYVKVSMDGAPYLRKVDLKTYNNYGELSSALEKMFSCFTIGQCNSPGLPVKDGLSESCLRDLLHGSEYGLTYEDKDGDWMLVGDVPWEMFIDSCKRLRIMKGSEAIGLAPRAMEKSRSQN